MNKRFKKNGRQIQTEQWNVIKLMANREDLEWDYNIGHLVGHTFPVVEHKIHIFAPYKSLVKIVIRKYNVGKTNYEIKSHDLTLHSYVDSTIWDMLKMGFEEWRRQVLIKRKK
jgi:hypothetical protein